MGTSLTGLTPATTYDALIKVGDNGPLSATAKYLSDGLGNDAPMSMSTTRVGIGTSSPSNLLHLNKASEPELYIQDSVSTFRLGLNSDNQFFIYTAQAKDIYFSNNNAERMRITSAGNVGIGTAAPNSKLEISAGTTIYPINITSSSGAATTTGISMGSFTGLAGGANGSVYIASAHNHAATAQSDMVFYTHTGSALTEKGRFLASGGLTFNGDTAAANALDDYEEGTFTATLSPSVSGTISLSPSTCSYTKIGRQVTVRGQIVVSAVSSPVGSIIVLGGLPFTSQNAVSSRGAGVFQYFPSIGSGSLVQNYQLQNSIEVNLISTASTIVAGDEFYISLTYFV